MLVFFLLFSIFWVVRMKTIVVRNKEGKKVATVFRFSTKRTPLVSVVDNPKSNFSIKLPLD